MKSAHLSDLHLGFRAFTAIVGGRNAREVDVEKAWEIAVDQVIEWAPHVCTIAGDVFHHPGVSDFAKLAFLEGIYRLLRTRCHVIVLQGNHDAGKTAAVLTPIALAGPLAWEHGLLHVVTTPKRIKLDLLTEHHRDEAAEHTSVAVACFPYVSRGDGETYTLEPDPDADVNILLMHAAVKGDGGELLPWFYSGNEAVDVVREAEKWDLVALGDYHEHTLLSEHGLTWDPGDCRHPVFYSGSIERTSSNIWDEHRPKGWVSYDTATHEYTFHEIPTRPMVDCDLGDFDFPPGATAEVVNECLTRISLLDHDLDGAIYRFKVDGFDRTEYDQIDWGTVREIRKRALHFDLDVRYAKPKPVEGELRSIEQGASLAQAWEDFTADEPDDVRALGTEYIEAADEAVEVGA